MNEAKRVNNEIILNSLLYIVSETGKKDYYNVLKVLYFADLHHLKNYGSLIARESYIAMNSGPVPSLAFDMVKAVKNGENCSFHDNDIEKLKDAFSLEGYKIVVQRAPDFDYFSDSSLKSLNHAIAEYGKLSGSKLKKLSHDDAYNSAGLDDIISVESMAQMFDDPDLVDYVKNPYP